MKRVLCFISSIAMIFTLAACETDEQKAYDFNGNWYSTKDGYLYVFNEGDVFCEENYVTLDSGKKTSGSYYEYKNYIEAYIIETIGAGADVAPLYLIRNQETDMLCSDVEGKSIIFCRDAAIVQQIVHQKEKEREEEKKKQEEQAAQEEKNKIINGPTVTYDSIVAGNHTGEIVAIEAIIGAYEYNDLLEMYEFDLWYWSDNKNRYIQDEGCHIFAENYSPEAIEPLKTFDDGDRIRMVFEVYADDSFGPSSYLWSELIEKGDLPDSGIPSNPESSNNSTGNTGEDSMANTSDIAVRFETDYIDGDRLHITVFTKNNSEETFSGNVYVTFYSSDGKDRLGSDTIIVDELLPGRESWADIIVDAYRVTPKMTVDFSEVSFTPIKEVVAEIDLDATEKTKRSYYWNFDGVSWYNDITDIAVYENGTCVVVLKDNPKEGGQFYASTIWSCGNDYGVDTVQVIDKEGTILSVYGDGDMISITPNSSGKIASSVDTPSSENPASQKTTASNNTTTTPVTPPQNIPAASPPTFTGSTCLEINYNGDGMPTSNVTSFTGADTVYVAGRLSGVTGENHLRIHWVFADGYTEDTMQYYVKNNEVIGIGLSAEYIGSGSCSVSIILDSTGEVLATYYFTVTGAPIYS